MKRFVEALIALVLTILLLPVGLPIAIALRVVGQRRSFFLQTRVGKGGRPFRLIKFTTMLDQVPGDTDVGPVIHSDPRVFPLGRLLRKTKLNEIPQILNVLKGDMSLVGPRPLTQNSYDKYPLTVRDSIAKLRPGITGVGSIVFRNEEQMLASSGNDRQAYYDEEILPLKGELEVWYSRHQSLWLDLKVLLATVIVVLAPTANVENLVFGRHDHPALPDASEGEHP